MTDQQYQWPAPPPAYQQQPPPKKKRGKLLIGCGGAPATWTVGG